MSATIILHPNATKPRILQRLEERTGMTCFIRSGRAVLVEFKRKQEQRHVSNDNDSPSAA